MAGRSVREHLRGVSDRWNRRVDRLGRQWGAFRETRFYAQALVAGGLVLLVWLSQTFPVGPLARIRSAALWTVTEQTDLEGHWRRARQWAERHGGWTAAVEATWARAGTRVREWARAVEGDLSRSDSGTIQALQISDPPVMPVRGAVLAAFGWSSGSDEEFHEGIDLMAEAGSTVVAVAAGTVRLIGSDPKVGRYVEVEHGPVVALYAQVDGVGVRAGQFVRKGEAIARVAPPRGVEADLPAHLHFEVRTGDGAVPVDPAAYLGLGGTRL